jgi:hypothetical protein
MICAFSPRFGKHILVSSPAQPTLHLQLKPLQTASTPISLLQVLTNLHYYSKQSILPRIVKEFLCMLRELQTLLLVGIHVRGSKSEPDHAFTF